MKRARTLSGNGLDRRARATRARLLRAAEDLFMKRGYDTTTVAQVARRAGVGVGTVYYHFSDKQALLLALIDDRAESLTARRPEDLDLLSFPEEDVATAIRRSIRGGYEALRKKPSLYLLVLALAERDPEVRRRYQKTEQFEIGRLRDFLEVGQRRGVIRDDIDRPSAAFLLHHILDTMAARFLVWEISEPNPEGVVEEVTDMICRYILTDDRQEAAKGISGVPLAAKEPATRGLKRNKRQGGQDEHQTD